MESGDEDDAFTMGEKDWQKMQRDLSKQGYRDGKNEGREKGMQQSFEAALSLSMKYTMKLGQLQGLIEWQLSQIDASDANKKEHLNRVYARLVSFQENFAEWVNERNKADNLSNEKVTEDELRQFINDIIKDYTDGGPDCMSIVTKIQSD